MSGQMTRSDGWAVIGLGRIAGAHLDALDTWTTSPVTSAVEPVAAQAAQYNLAPVFPGIGALLDEARPKAAIVCSPPSTHRMVVMELLRAGVHVLVEKPLATSAVDAWEMVREARERGLVLQTSGKFGEMVSLQRAAALAADGLVGQVIRVDNVFAAPLDALSDWHATRAISGGGVLMDNGPHSLDVVTTVAGPVRSVRTLVFEGRQGGEVEDEIAFEALCEDGTLAHVHLSWNEAVRAPVARIEGTDGVLVVDWKGLRLERRGTVEELAVDGPSGYDKVDCFSRLLERFADRIEDPRANVADERGAQALDVIEAVYRSAKTGTWEDIRWTAKESRLHTSPLTSTP